MERYVALLRGVNVGGKNKVSMPVLKAALEQAGFSQVSTYINSGNVLFSCEAEEPVALQQKCSGIIMDTFQLDIPVAVIPAAVLIDAISRAPEWWDRDADSKQNAIFLIAPTDAETMIRKVGVNPEYEKIAFHGPVIFWSAPLRTFSRTKWSKVVAASAYAYITIRNANTAKKLMALLEM